MEGKWKIEVFPDGSQFRWKLISRNGDLVMTSQPFPTEAGARISAENEVNELRQAVLAG